MRQCGECRWAEAAAKRVCSPGSGKWHNGPVDLRFDAYGNLPPGIHRMSIDHVLAIFASGTARREWLGTRLREIVALAAASGIIRRVYTWGRFVTATANPRDLDVLLVLRPEWGDDDPPHPLGTVLNHEQARSRFQADVFWVPEDVGEAVIADLFDAFMIDREKRQRGIVEVEL